MLFGSLWNPSILDGINQKKDKKEDIYVLLFDESLIQQLKKKPAGHPSINSTLGSHLCQCDLNYHQNGNGPLDNETITTLSVFYLNL
jgi:hypothetical protein